MTIENIADIEKLIRLDSKDPSYKGMLFEALTHADVYILASTEYVPNANGADQVPANEDRPPNVNDTHLAITLWEDSKGNAAIPFFSSVEVLQESIESEETYVQLGATELFELTMGTSLILNPVSDYSREFSIDDIKSILSIAESDK
tara:strand:- start:325617 stop:326057 length:441 start_codon:yes stop_codon:yes gene_type:complete